MLKDDFGQFVMALVWLAIGIVLATSMINKPPDTQALRTYPCQLSEPQ